MNQLEALGMQIVLQRERLGWTQAELAKRAGLHRYNLGTYERGTVSMKAVTLRRIADVLGCSMDDLLGKVDK